MRIEKAGEVGFCLGVRRAIDILEKVARKRGEVETLGPVVHNEQVVQRLAKLGIKVAKSLAEVEGNTVAVSTHGVSPDVETELRARHVDIIDTTCPFVHRAQLAARRLADSNFFVIVYGEAEHPEVKGVLGWARNKGVAILNDLSGSDGLPRRLGILSQTTQVPAHFTEFVKKLIETNFAKDSELRIIDTICHDLRKRQAAAIQLAKKVDLMLVIGGHNSANTNRLAELCATVTKTYLIETAEEVQPSWLHPQSYIGLTAGASTGDETVSEVIVRLEAMAST